jgi:hypothetical protein
MHVVALPKVSNGDKKILIKLCKDIYMTNSTTLSSEKREVIRRFWVRIPGVIRWLRWPNGKAPDYGSIFVAIVKVLLSKTCPRTDNDNGSLLLAY